MSDVTLEGQHCTAVSLLVRRRAAWVARLSVEGTEAPALGARATLASGDGAFVGVVDRANVSRAGVVQVRLVGAAGLNATLPPRSYAGRPSPSSGTHGPLTARTVLGGIAQDAGETLSPTIATELLDTELPAWVRPRMRGTLALDALGEALGAAWRVLADGTVWMGVETWPEVDVPTAILLSDEPLDSSRTVACDVFDPTLAPGVTWMGQKVDVVWWKLSGNQLGAEVEAPVDGGATLDDDRDDREAAIKARAAVVEIYALGVHRARVVVQHSDGTLDLEPEGDAATRMWAGMTSVPMRPTMPGLSMVFTDPPRDLYALFAFEGADPRRPVVVAFERNPDAQGSVSILVGQDGVLHLGATAGEQFVALADKVHSALEALKAFATTHTHVVSGAAAQASTTPLSVNTDVAAQQVKAG